MKFKCKSTNLVYNFEFEVDIMSMMKHPDYESVPDNECMDETPSEVSQEETKPVAKTTKKQSKVTPDESSIDGS
jgi:hypothetical protein